MTEEQAAAVEAKWQAHHGRQAEQRNTQECRQWAQQFGFKNLAPEPDALLARIRSALQTEADFVQRKQLALVGAQLLMRKNESTRAMQCVMFEAELKEYQAAGFMVAVEIVPGDRCAAAQLLHKGKMSITDALNAGLLPGAGCSRSICACRYRPVFDSDPP